MKDVQMDLLGYVDPLGLTERQRAAFDMLALHREGLGADVVGAQLHFLRGKHPSYTTCDWCATDGTAVLVELRTKGLTVQRRQPTRWQLTKAGLREAPPLPMDDIPEGF